MSNQTNNEVLTSAQIIEEIAKATQQPSEAPPEGPCRVSAEGHR